MREMAPEASTVSSFLSQDFSLLGCDTILRLQTIVTEPYAAVEELFVWWFVVVLTQLKKPI